MATKRTKQGKPTSINLTELPQRRAVDYLSTYSNYVEVGSSPWDIRLLFFEIQEDETGNLIREKKAHVVMSPQHAVAFAKLLRDGVQGWVNEYAPNMVRKSNDEET